MTKHALLILLAAFLIGCNTTFRIMDNISNHTLYYNESFSDIPNEGCLGAWLNTKIKYTKDTQVSDYWKNPSNTFLEGSGDCEDFALLYLNILYVQFNKKGSLIRVNKNNLYDTNINNFNHVMVIHDGYIVSPQNGMRYGTLENIRPNGEGVYSFDEAYVY